MNYEEYYKPLNQQTRPTDEELKKQIDEMRQRRVH